MGIAAYYRGNNLRRRQLEATQRPQEFWLMDELNALEKYPDVGTPFGAVTIYPHRNAWVFECPETGYGFWYASLREGIRRWNIDLTEYDAVTHRWKAMPRRLAEQ